MLLDHWTALRIKSKADDYKILGTQIYLTKKYFSVMTRVLTRFLNLGTIFYIYIMEAQWREGSKIF